MVLNQQLTEKLSKDFWERLDIIIGNWLPYTTNYLELKEEGWHTEHDYKNVYVSEKIGDREEPFIKQYHHAWASCPKKQELIDLIKSCEYLKTDEALAVFTEVTGIQQT